MPRCGQSGAAQRSGAFQPPGGSAPITDIPFTPETGEQPLMKTFL
jgi:hypothetical protein